MRGIKKYAAVLTACGMLITMAVPVQAEWTQQQLAVYSSLDFSSYPMRFSGFEEIDDCGLFSGKEGDDVCAVYQSQTNPDFLVVLSGYEQSSVKLTKTSADSGWQEIYEKYGAELDFDVVQDGTAYAFLYDTANAEGQVIQAYTDYDSPDALEAKRLLVQDLCADLYAAGLIRAAEYHDYYADYTMYGFDSGAIRILDSTIDIEPVKEALSEMDDTIEVVLHEDGYYRVQMLSGMEQALAAAGEIKAIYPETEISAVAAPLDDMEHSCCSQGVDLLADLSRTDEIMYGDANQDGKISVLDAIHLSKAAAQIVRMNTAQTAAGDCNGDGMVDTQDVTVLLMYLTDKIESLPMTDEQTAEKISETP
ncbi:MAG: dockerin type I repeat-containing protein [Ruminococcus sp.]|nr:dockerin type I repeat-containing protein [Ruminococcus sp.]